MLFVHNQDMFVLLPTGFGNSTFVLHTTDQLAYTVPDVGVATVQIKTLIIN